MKTLKFRIYDKTEKRMKFLGSIWNMPDPSYDFDEIQQFTGLLDCNGKEIYEGDIVKVTGYDNLIAEVAWEGSAFVNCFDGDHLSLVGTEEVIGNVFENPDLLK